MLVYEQNPERRDGAFDPMRCNAVKCYMRHFNNSLYLTFMLANGTTTEKHDASKELEICERKMKYWERQPHFDEHEADLKRVAAKKRWA